MLLMDIKNKLSEIDNKERIIKESLDSDAAGDAYYKVNEAALKLQEIKPYIEDSEAEKLYNKIMIDLNELQVSFTKSNLGETFLFKDIKSSDGIHSYYEMLYGQEPQSEYDRLVLQYMKKSDEIREELSKTIDEYRFDSQNPKYKSIIRKLADEDRENIKLMAKANEIPEDERGPLYQDFLQIDKENNDEFAKQRGYNSYDEYEKHIFGEGDKVDYEILDKPNDPEDFIVKDIPDDKLPVDLAKKGKCPYCTGPMSYEEYKVFGMCKDCYDNGVE